MQDAPFKGGINASLGDCAGGWHVWWELADLADEARMRAGAAEWQLVSAAMALGQRWQDEIAVERQLAEWEQSRRLTAVPLTR